jgi:predicted small metal-binding protein
MENLKKRSDSVMDSPLRTPTGAGTGSSEDASATRLSVENASREAREGRDLHFRCADVGDPQCKWEARGSSEEELMPQIERHGREAHNINNIDGSMRNRIRTNIRRAA